MKRREECQESGRQTSSNRRWPGTLVEGSEGFGGLRALGGFRVQGLRFIRVVESSEGFGGFRV